MPGSIAEAIAAAKSKLGARYVWGATGPNVFDCSGLTQWAWKQAGVNIPRTSQQQAKYGRAVPLSKIQAGDLVTSHWGRGGPSSHVALYLGGGKLIHAPAPGKRVTYSTLDAEYARHIDAIRRVPGATGAPPSDGATFADFDFTPFGPDFVEDALGQAGDAVAGTILEPLADIARGSMSMAQSMLSIGEFATLLLRLALPSTWVRIASGALGGVLLFLGIAFLIRETRESR